MRITNLAKAMASFRRRFSVIKDTARERNLVKYYAGLIRMHQVYPLFNETGSIVALCEVWRIKERDIEKIKRFEDPKSIFKGPILFIANVTADPNYRNLNIYSFYKKMIKILLCPNKEITKAFWYNNRHAHFTHMFTRKWTLNAS